MNFVQEQLKMLRTNSFNVLKTTSNKLKHVIRFNYATLTANDSVIAATKGTLPD